MADPTGFIKVKRKEAGNRTVAERIADYSEVEQILNSEDRMLQASRCMDCGIPFCHWGCPVDNLIPEWNDLLYKGEWKAAWERLAATNNFPEFTGRICPAPCEHSCVLNIEKDPVTIRENEVAIIEKAFSEGYVKPAPPSRRTGMKVAVIGSGPAGLAAADQLNKAGHHVIVFEKERKPGGLLRYGIPDFKLSKAVVERRINLMAEEGVEFRCNTEVGKNITANEIVASFDAVCIAIGAQKPRDINVEGRELKGIHFAMDFLSQQNKINDGETATPGTRISAEGLRVVVIGGGDTGSDCVGTAIRQKAASVTQIEIMPKPPIERSPENPWPYFGKTLKTTTSHEEGCERFWGVSTRRFRANGEHVAGIEAEAVTWDYSDGKAVMNVVEGSQHFIEADLVLLSMGFLSPVAEGLITELELVLDKRNNISASVDGVTSASGIFAAGDAAKGASLVVTAIASGRRTAAAINRYLNEK